MAVKRDGRALSHEVSEEIRRLAVERVRLGEDASSVMSSYGMCRTTIYKWMRAVAKAGVGALTKRKHPGPKSKLAEKQKLAVARWMNGKDPRQFGFDFGLWTRKIVCSLIKKTFDIDLGVTAAGRLLAELGITPQKPLRRAYERDPVAVAQWKEVDYPALVSRARRRGAEIFFLDETGLRSDSTLGRTWAPRGETPVLRTSGRRQSVNVISAVNAKGAFWYELYAGNLNAGRFVEFLTHLIKGRRKPVFLVLDSHPSHKAKMVAAYIQGMKGKLELHFLPGYAPDVNPDEFVWKHLKTEGVSKRPLMQGESLAERVALDLQTIQEDRALVRTFFQAESVAYTVD